MAARQLLRNQHHGALRIFYMSTPISLRALITPLLLVYVKVDDEADFMQRIKIMNEREAWSRYLSIFNENSSNAQPSQ